MNNDKIREALEELVYETDKWTPPLPGGRTRENPKIAIDRCLAAIEKEMPRWIPCSERLPEDRKRVLGNNEMGLFVCWQDAKFPNDDGSPGWFMPITEDDSRCLEYEEEWPTHWLDKLPDLLIDKK